eukprot:scaffold2705_cov109-Isochrysis_galbana.AAC.17
MQAEGRVGGGPGARRFGLGVMTLPFGSGGLWDARLRAALAALAWPSCPPHAAPAARARFHGRRRWRCLTEPCRAACCRAGSMRSRTSRPSTRT